MRSKESLESHTDFSIVNCSGGSETFLYFNQRHDQNWESSKNAIDRIMLLIKNANYATLRSNIIIQYLM